MIRISLMIFTAILFSCSIQQDIHKESSTINTIEEQTKPALAHTVYFWLKDGTSQKEENEFRQGLKKLGGVPSLQTYYWGKPAPTEDRGVIDNSYHYAINSFFNSIKDHDIYQEHPLHLEFIENHKHIWEKVVVYDNEMD